MHIPMKTLLPVVLLIIISMLVVPTALAQVDRLGKLSSAYDLSWWTVDGGGSNLAVGNYAFDGTIGQPDAATVKNGSYVLEGGFWSGFESTYSIFLPVVVK